MCVLPNALMHEGFQAEFKACVHGFGDSLPVLKCTIPSLSSFKLPDIHMPVCKRDSSAHDASHDVTALVDILPLVKANLAPMMVTVGSVVALMAFEADEAGNSRCSGEGQSTDIWYGHQGCCKWFEGTPPSNIVSP